jgi:hypothetical protein
MKEYRILCVGATGFADGIVRCTLRKLAAYMREPVYDGDAVAFEGTKVVAVKQDGVVTFVKGGYQ